MFTGLSTLALLWMHLVWSREDALNALIKYAFLLFALWGVIETLRAYGYVVKVTP